MKKREFKKLALMGLTSGLLINASGAEATESSHESPQQSTLAKGCGGGGCGGTRQKSCGGGACGGGRQKSCGGGSCGGALQRSCGGGSCGGAPKRSCGGGSCGGSRQKNCGSLAEGDKPDSATMPYASPSKYDNYKNVDPNDGNLNHRLLTEQELKLELNQEGIRMYNSLSPEGKAMALKEASMSCNGTNDCKGLGACKTDKNNCAGQNDCKGQGKCAVADKNMAVKLVYKKMQEKRNNALRQN